MSDERRDEGRQAREDVWLDASPERVWRALTDAEELERWFPLEARVEPGEGGEIYMSWGNEFAGSSRIVAWEPPRRLATTWGEWDGEAGGGQVTEYRLSREVAWERLEADAGVEAATRGASAGEPVADAPPWQYAARLEEPRGALMRLTVDPCMAEPDRRDVTVFVSAWGDAGDRFGEIGRAWTERLERLFPEGETV